MNYILVMVDSSDKTWSTGEGNVKPLQYSCLVNLMTSMKGLKKKKRKEKKNDTKRWSPRSVVVQYATGDQWKNNSRKIEDIGSKQKQYPFIDVTGGGSEVQCCENNIA